MLRTFSVLLTSVILASTLASAVATRAPAALACSGGLSLQFAIDSSVIVLGDAVAVGDEVNRAPTITPTVTWTASATPTRTAIFASGTPMPTAVSPPVGGPPSLPSGAFGTPEGFSLAGYGVTLEVVRAYGGTREDLPAPHDLLVVDGETRASIEHDLRRYEAGTGAISSCPIAAFVPKYTTGARYLVFAGRDSQSEFGLFTTYRLRVEGQDVLLSGPAISFEDAANLFLTATQYHRYFEGIAAEVSDENDFARITSDRVPLGSVLRLASELSGRALIAPPETGSAGLASR